MTITAGTAVRPDGRVYRPRAPARVVERSPDRVTVAGTHHVPTATKLALELIHRYELEQVRPQLAWKRWVPWPAPGTNGLVVAGHWRDDARRGVPVVVWDREASLDEPPRKNHVGYLVHLHHLAYSGHNLDGAEFLARAPTDGHLWVDAETSPDLEVVWLTLRGDYHQALVDNRTGEVHRSREYGRKSTVDLDHLAAQHQRRIDEVFGLMFAAACSCSWEGRRRKTRKDAEQDWTDHRTRLLVAGIQEAARG